MKFIFVLGERYNPIYNRWDQIADMLCPRSNLASVIVDNAIFVIGGFNGNYFKIKDLLTMFKHTTNDSCK